MRRGWLLAVACICILVAVIAARPRPTPGPFLRDFEAYWAAGSAWNSHADPYGRAIWNQERTIAGVDERHDEMLPYVGPPFALLAWSAFARTPYAGAAALWSAILTAFLLLLVASAIHGSAQSIAPSAFLGALALAIGFAPVTSDFALGQLALPAFTSALLVVLAAARSLPAATAAACVAFVQPNASLGLISQLGRNRATLAMAFGVIVTYVLGSLAMGWAWPATYAGVIAAHDAAERFAAIQISPASVAYGFGATRLEAEFVGLACALLAIAAAIVLAIRLGERFARFAAFSALAPFAAGFVHEHDVVVAYAAAVWCALRTRGTTRAVALAGTLLAGVDWLGFAQRPAGIAQSALLALAAVAAFAALGNETHLRAGMPVIAGLAVLFGAAAWLAVNNPAPVWPDALGAFHAPTGASIATIWSAEQRASGLFAVQPVWAALRSLSLLGCALLAYAIYRHSSCCRTA